jgi:hypothetical protein
VANDKHKKSKQEIIEELLLMIRDLIQFVCQNKSSFLRIVNPSSKSSLVTIKRFTCDGLDHVSVQLNADIDNCQPVNNLAIVSLSGLRKHLTELPEKNFNYLDETITSQNFLVDYE